MFTPRIPWRIALGRHFDLTSMASILTELIGKPSGPPKAEPRMCMPVILENT